MVWDVVLRLVVAALLTAVIGIDRELRSKPAGLRTNIVVGTATAAFAYMGSEVIAGGQADPTRVASQVVSGIGFLGGGAIFAAGGRPSGLTTAAALWGSAAAGLAAGLGRFDIGLALVVVLLVILWPLDVVGGRALRTYGRQVLRAQVVLDDLTRYPHVRRSWLDDRVKVLSVAISSAIDGRPTVDVQLAGRGQMLAEVLHRLETADGVVIVAHDSGTLPAE